MDYNLTDEQKNVTLEYVLNQPVKAVENFDLTKRAIKYSTLIKGKKINEIKGDEEITRACILTKLTNEYGYALEDIELEHEYTAGRPHTNTSIIDVIVRDKKGDAFLFMELKSPDAYTSEDKDKIIEEQLFKVAAMEQAEGHFVKYLVLYTISVLGNEIKDDCIIIDHEKYITYKDWEVERDYANEIPVKYGKAQKIPYIKGSAKDLETHFTNEMLTSLQNDLHNVLWGGGGTGDNDVFSSLTNLILAKIQDEVEKDNGQKYDFQCFAFKDEETDEYESLDDLYERINGLYRRALENKLNITGKTIKNLAQNYISDMPIYVPDIIEQKRIIDKVEPILDKIFALKKSVESKRSIIDAVFKEYFGYDYDKFESLKTMTYYSSYSQYGNNIDTRFSAKFHRPAGEFVYQELNSRPNKKIKKLLILPMITGQGIATTDYDENGDYAYVSMADISSWSLNLNDIKYVSNDYAKKKLTKKIKGNKTPISTEIGLNDILLMRSGEGGIGKVAIVEDDAKGIFCDFIIRMRFDENQMNPLFAYYYFCTRYFQYLVEINKKGLGNNTNIFPNQIQEFPIPYISLNEQKLIVDSINAELEKQKVIDKKIMKEREKIEKILAAVIA